MLAGVASLAVLAGSTWVAGGSDPAPAALRSHIVSDDAGDGRATTTYDGPMVRRRVAVAVHPVEGADRDLLRKELRRSADGEHLGPLTDATFAVFSQELLKYLVPEVVVVLPEGASVADGEILMKDHTYPGVAFYLVEPVLVHDLAFAVLPEDVPVAEVRARIDREGVLTDSLGKYATALQRRGLVVSYFGALLSDGQVMAVRQSISRAASVDVDRVIVAPVVEGGGVDLSREPLQEPGADQHGGHHG
jgi:hypothetical protein